MIAEPAIPPRQFDTAHRKAMLRNLAHSLVEHERIKTTLPRAKEVRRIVEKAINFGKKSYLAKDNANKNHFFEKFLELFHRDLVFVKSLRMKRKNLDLIDGLMRKGILIGTHQRKSKFNLLIVKMIKYLKLTSP